MSSDGRGKTVIDRRRAESTRSLDQINDFGLSAAAETTGEILNLTAYTSGIPVHTHAAYPNEINLYTIPPPVYSQRVHSNSELFRAGDITPTGHHYSSTLPNQNTFSDHNIHYSDAASAGIEGLHGNFSLNDTNGIPHFTSPLADFPGAANPVSLTAVPDPPLIIAAPPLVGRNSRSRRPTAQFICSFFPDCKVTFTRKSDLLRHEENQHRAPQHDCPVDGCNRKGAKGFRRKDKLVDHQRKKHKMTI